MDLGWWYSLDELKSFDVSTMEGQRRLHAVEQQLPLMLKAVGISLPSRPRILCLMAGSCIEGLAFSRLHGVEVTCLDVQEKMLNKGVREARRRKLHLKAVAGDVKNFAHLLRGEFDLITLFGSPLAHVSLNDFDKVVGESRKVMTPGGGVFIQQADMIFRILLHYRDSFAVNEKPPVLNSHVAFDPIHGDFERLYFGGGKSMKTKSYLWSPWIIEYALMKGGFRQVNVKAYPDPIAHKDTYLFYAM